MWITTAEAASDGAEVVASRLQVDIRNGLWWSEAERRRHTTGYNELTCKEEEPTWKKYVEQVAKINTSIITIYSTKNNNNKAKCHLFYYSLKIH